MTTIKELTIQQHKFAVEVLPSAVKAPTLSNANIPPFIEQQAQYLQIAGNWLNQPA